MKLDSTSAVTIIIIGNGLVGLGSNPGRSYLHIPLY